MNNEEQIHREQEPIVAEDGLPRNSRVEAEPIHAGHTVSQAFSKAMKSAIDPEATSRGRTEPKWESIPGLAEITAGRSWHESGSPPLTVPGSKGSAIDLNVKTPAIGALLAHDHSERPHESQLAEDDSLHIDRVSIEPANFPGTRLDPNVGGSESRQVGDGPRSTVARNQEAAAVPEGPKVLLKSGPESPIAGHPGPVGLISLADSLGGSRAGDNSSGSPAPVIRAALQARPEVVDLPRGNPVGDQLAFAPGSPDTSRGASGDSPYSVNIHESSVASSAFAPVLSGVIGSRDGGASAFSESGGGEGDGHSSQDAMSGLSIPSGADQANGPAPDLSRTNELLQQLLDEVRKGRQPFLPINDRNSSH